MHQYVKHRPIVLNSLVELIGDAELKPLQGVAGCKSQEALPLKSTIPCAFRQESYAGYQKIPKSS